MVIIHLNDDDGWRYTAQDWLFLVFSAETILKFSEPFLASDKICIQLKIICVAESKVKFSASTAKFHFCKNFVCVLQTLWLRLSKEMNSFGCELKNTNQPTNCTLEPTLKLCKVKEMSWRQMELNYKHVPVMLMFMQDKHLGYSLFAYLCSLYLC